MVLWPPNNFEIDSGETLSESSHTQIFFPTTIMEPNNFQQATGEELEEIIDAMTLNEDVSINDYIFWSSTRDGMFNDIRRVTLGTLLSMIELEASAETPTTIGAVVTASTEKTTPVDADMVPITDSAASHILKKVSWANIKATIKTYTDTLYSNLAHIHVTADITDISSYTWFDARYFTESEVTSLLAGKSATGHTHTTSEITDLSSYTGFDARYFTEAEVTSLLSGKSAIGHTHTASEITDLSSYTGFDARYFTESEITALLSGKQDSDAQLTGLAGLSYTGNALKVIRVNAWETGFELATVSWGGGWDVTKVWTPVNNQLAIWTWDGTLEGTSDITYDGTNLNLITGKNFQIAGITILADAAGTTTLSNIDAIDATTESTIEAAIDTLANLTSIQGRTITLADAGANAVFGWDDVAWAYENLTASEVRAAIGLATSDSPMFTAIELGHASDTTITRVSAGVIAVEWVNLVKAWALTSSWLTMATARLLGRTTASTGAVEELTVGSSLSFAAGAIDAIQDIRTSASPQFTWVNIGHASDTTVTRSAAGILAVEWVDIPTTGSTHTFTNKRITKRVTTASDATSITPNTDNCDITYQANTQAAGTLTINADSGTPTNWQSWLLKIKSTNVQTFSWNAVFAGGTNALPTASSGSSKIDYFSFIYDTVNSKWHYTGSALNF